MLQRGRFAEGNHRGNGELGGRARRPPRPLFRGGVPDAHQTASRRCNRARKEGAMNVQEREVSVSVEDGVTLNGSLVMPDGAKAVVLFAHGSGSSRHSPRNRYVAGVLHRSGLATLLIDLLSVDEEEAERFTRHLRFDIELLAGRLVGVTHWLLRDPSTSRLAIGYFGSSTGAAAALVAAAREPDRIGAVVSRGGRPDLAGDALPRVRAPTLLIVGGADSDVIELNREALDLLETEKRLEIVPEATHLFEEPGTLERVAELASRWFVSHLAAEEHLWNEETGQWL
jgi:putative phosphoribosyl transferase